MNLALTRPRSRPAVLWITEKAGIRVAGRVACSSFRAQDISCSGRLDTPGAQNQRAPGNKPTHAIGSNTTPEPA